MPHIDLNNDLPGIRGLMQYRPDAALALNRLAESLLRTDEGLTMGERELIATYVSYLNHCNFCQRFHGAVAAYYCGEELVQFVKQSQSQTGLSRVDPTHAKLAGAEHSHSDASQSDQSKPNLSPRLQHLLRIAAAVQQLDRPGCTTSIAQAQAAGISDLEIHDTVLIAAAFCMFNRYVDGHATFAPDDPDLYRFRARLLVEETGYLGAKPG